MVRLVGIVGLSHRGFVQRLGDCGYQRIGGVWSV